MNKAIRDISINALANFDQPIKDFSPAEKIAVVKEVRREVSTDYQAVTDMEVLSESGEVSGILNLAFIEGAEPMFAARLTMELTLGWFEHIVHHVGADHDEWVLRNEPNWIEEARQADNVARLADFRAEGF